MRRLPISEAIGHKLCHDMTKIIPKQYKGVAFKRGHIIREEDVNALKDMGKEHVFIWEDESEWVHEDDAALILAKHIAGEGLKLEGPREGKITFKSTHRGLLKIDTEKLKELNQLGQLILATRHNHFEINADDMVAGTRVVPLRVERSHLEKALNILDKPILNILPFQMTKAAVIATGNEIYYGRIKDQFTAIIKEKLKPYPVILKHYNKAPDDWVQIRDAILNAVDSGCKLVICTGGMSVDPDDRTPRGIKETGAKIIAEGVPVLPGSAFRLAKLNDTWIIGVPGCGMYSEKTVFDIILPRVLANDTITEEEMMLMGHGGLCLKCEKCHYPNCSFGKGW